MQPAPVRGLPSKTLPEGTEVCARVRTLRYDLGNLSNAVCVVLRKVCEFASSPSCCLGVQQGGLS